jgi:flagellar biosynthesis/type III secretory pathway protein FliH
MLCKVTADSDDVKPVLWRTLAGAALTPGAQGSNRDVAPGEVAELQKRIADLERLRQTEVAQAKQAGLEEGKQKAWQEGAAEITASLDRLAQKLTEVAALRSKMRIYAEMDIVKLGLAIAQRILRRELTTDPETIHGLVHAALQKIQNRDILKIRVYPAGAEALKASLARAGAAPAIQVVPDPMLKTGDLLFETSVGELDASVETQLQEVERGLADRLALR